ncbi:MAG TPA: hypothetical protein ENN76_03455 [Euryarchaeota archaeon]|nr:hypothetical protein [Euryarchaeota archaeon]
MYCGQCAEVCPPKVIHLGKNIENSDFERKKIRVDHIQKIADMLKRREAEKPKVTQ